MKTNRFKFFLDKIEPILFEKAKNMNVPTLEEDVGVLIFEATFYKYSKNEIYKKKALSLLDKLIQVLPDRELSPGFLEGFEGLFFAIYYLRKCDIIEDETLLDDLMPYLFQSLKMDIKENVYDVLHGSINKLQYLMGSEKRNDKQVTELVYNFVNSLYKHRQETEQGIFWFDEFEDEVGLVNLGLAHGITSLLVFLLRLKELNYKHPKIMVLIEGILKSLFNFKNKILGDSNFLDFYRINDKPENKEKQVGSRLAYCYGDLGIAYALLYASKVLKRDNLKSEGAEIVKDIIQRKLGNSKLEYFDDYFFFETAFCHGLSGITYMLMKINHLLNSPVLESRITFWKNELIHNLTTQLKIKGKIYYPSYRQPDKTNPFIIDEVSILGGYTGTGLVLLSLYYKKYDWSDFFLLY